MKIAIVVDLYPILSQSFINRLISDLCIYEDIDVDILTVNPFEPLALQKWSSENYSLWKSGRISVLSFSKNKRLGYYLKLLKVFFIYLLKLPLGKKELSYSDVFTVGIKYHLKAAMLSDMLKRRKYDILHPQFLSIAIYTILAKNITPNGRVFTTGRGADVSTKTAISAPKLHVLDNDIIGTEKYLFVSQSLMDIAVKKGVQKGKCSVLYSGIDLSNLKFRLPDCVQKKRTIRLIQVGRLTEKKGIFLTLNVFSQLSKKYDLTLTVVGEGDLYTAAYEVAKNNDILKNVHFFGARNNNECLRLMGESDILLVPSMTGKNGDSEGIPNVAKEAMALGCIVVSSDHAGLKELIDDGVTGYVFREADVTDFQCKLELALNLNSQWPEMAVKAREVVETKFSIDKIGTEMVSFYRKALGTENEV
jgi:colanic acid/amylovoran biosynthesis glycosyltransferase